MMSALLSLDRGIGVALAHRLIGLEGQRRPVGQVVDDDPGRLGVVGEGRVDRQGADEEQPAVLAQQHLELEHERLVADPQLSGQVLQVAEAAAEGRRHHLVAEIRQVERR